MPRLPDFDHGKIISEIKNKIFIYPYATIFENGDAKLHFDESTDYTIALRKFRKIRKYMQKITLAHSIDDLSNRELIVREYAFLYLLLNDIVGTLTSFKNKARNVIGKTNENNDGSNKQHWIPNTYSKLFTNEDEKHTWWTYEDLLSSQGQEGAHPNEVFCEMESTKGSHYPHNIELVLAEHENFYSIITPKESNGPISIWEHIVTSTFFYILFSRTFEKKKANSKYYKELIESQWESMLSFVKATKISIISKNTILPTDSSHFFITQDPVTCISIGDEDFSLAAPYSADLFVFMTPCSGYTLSQDEMVEFTREILHSMFSKTKNYEDARLYTKGTMKYRVFLESEAPEKPSRYFSQG